MSRETTGQRRKKILMADVTNLRTDSRLMRESSTLVKAGYRVILLGYNRDNMRFHEEGKVNGITFWELPYAKTEAKSRFFFILQILLRDLRFFFGFYRRILFTNANIYHAHNIYSLPIMWLSAKLRGHALVYDSHELFCEWRKHGPYSGAKKWMLNRFVDLEHVLCRHADAMICVSTGIQKILARIHKIRRPVIIENFPLRSEVLESQSIGKLRKKLSLPLDSKIVIYVGGFYKHLMRLDNLICVAPVFPEVAFVLMGFDSLGYKEELVALSRKIGADNVLFVDPVPPTEVVEYVGDANVAVNLNVGKLLMLKYCSSNKIFQYLAAGLPIVCSNTLQSVRKATEAYNVCNWVDPNSLEGLKSALCGALSMTIDEEAEVRKRAQLCVKEMCCWEAQEDRLVKLYRNL